MRCLFYSFFSASLFFSGGARPREGAARLAGSRAGARSSVAGRGEDEDGGNWSLVLGSLLEKAGFGFVTLCLYVTQMLGIGLVFAFSRWRRLRNRGLGPAGPAC